MDTSNASGRRSRSVADLGYRYGLIVAWVLLIVVFSVLLPSLFFTASNFQTLLGSQAVLLVLTLGLLIPLTAGEFDLSVGGTLTISLVLIGYLNALHGWPLGLAILAALAAGLLVGAINAFLVVVVGVDSIVVTLGSGTLLAGAALGITNLSISGISNWLITAARFPIFGIQAAFYYALALTIVTWYVLDLTPLGRYLYFVGAGRDVARLSGISVSRIRGGTLVYSGVAASLAGVLMAGTLGAADPNIGPFFLLPAFAGVFLGATAIRPGRFNAWGSFVAVYFLVTGITGLQLLGLYGWINQVFYGGSLIIAVALSRLAARRDGAPRRIRSRREARLEGASSDMVSPPNERRAI